MKGILTWHSVDDSGSVISVNRSQLEAQLDALVAARVEIVPLSRIAQLPDEVNAAALTFDDGFLNFYDDALPALESRAMPATIFVVASYVGASNDWETGSGSVRVPNLPLMSWDQLRDISSRGFEVGSHAMAHRHLDQLTEGELQYELAQSADLIESGTGTRPTSFAYPFGSVDKNVIAAASGIFHRCCTTVFSTLPPNHSPHELPRLDTYYFRDGESLRGWGGARFSARIAGISAKRAIGSAVRTIRG